MTSTLSRPLSRPQPPAPPAAGFARRFLRGEITRPVALTAIVASGLIGEAVVRHAFAAAPFWPSAYGLILAVHVGTVTPALPLGAWLLLQPKGDARHRTLGRVWAVLMLVTAFTSFGITRLTGTLSPIHLLSLLTISSIVRGIRFARAGDIPRHRRSMVLAFTGVVGAAAFTLLPGRLLGAWILG